MRTNKEEAMEVKESLSHRLGQSKNLIENDRRHYFKKQFNKGF